MEIRQHLIRQFDLIPEDALTQKITVIGAGAIGSFTILSLAKMGFENIEVWDADVVSVENMNSQFYRFSDIDRPKVVALRNLVKDFTNVEIKIKLELYEGGLLDGIVISAVDSMAVRRNIWENLFEKTTSVKAVIDPRMGAETALLYVNNPVDPKDNESYLKTLYTDENALQERCTAKSTMYTAVMLSGLVAKCVKDLAVTSETFRSVEWSIKDNDFICHKKFDPAVESERAARRMGDFARGRRAGRTADSVARDVSATYTSPTSGRIYDLVTDGTVGPDDIYDGFQGPYRPRAEAAPRSYTTTATFAGASTTASSTISFDNLNYVTATPDYRIPAETVYNVGIGTQPATVRRAGFEIEHLNRELINLGIDCRVHLDLSTPVNDDLRYIYDCHGIGYTYARSRLETPMEIRDQIQHRANYDGAIRGFDTAGVLSADTLRTARDEMLRDVRTEPGVEFPAPDDGVSMPGYFGAYNTSVNMTINTRGHRIYTYIDRVSGREYRDAHLWSENELRNRLIQMRGIATDPSRMQF